MNTIDLNSYDEFLLNCADISQDERETAIETAYKYNQEQARQEAKNWQYGWQDSNYSYSELAEWQAHFYKLAKRYGLLQEFRENGII